MAAVRLDQALDLGGFPAAPGEERCSEDEKKGSGQDRRAESHRYSWEVRLTIGKPV
jgi:hypothetical protein